MPGDHRSVAELLLHADLAARDLLLNPDPDLAAGMVRAWQEMATAAEAFWDALPGQASWSPYRPPMRDAVDQIRDQARVLSRRRDRVVKGSLNRVWPRPDDAPDPRVQAIASDLTQAADLVARYTAGTPAGRVRTPEGDRDLNAACARAMHAVYVTAHATASNVGRYAAEIHAQAQRTRNPRSVHRARQADQAAELLQHTELVAGTALGPTPTVPAPAQRDPIDPARLRDALTGWEQATTSLDHDPVTVEQLRWVAHVQEATTAATGVIAAARHSEADGGVQDALRAAHTSWARAGALLTGMADPAGLPPRDQVVAGNELLATLRQITWEGNTLASPGVIRSRIEPDHAALTLHRAQQHGATLATAIRAAAEQGRVTGRARPLLAAYKAAHPNPNAEAAAVQPDALNRNETIPLPAALAWSLQQATDRAALASTGAAAAIARDLPTAGRGETIAAALGPDSPAALALRSKQLERILGTINHGQTKTPTQPLPDPDLGSRLQRARELLAAADQGHHRHEHYRRRPKQEGPSLR